MNDVVSVGVLYDQPFGATVKYPDSNNFISNGGDAAIKALTKNTYPAVHMKLKNAKESLASSSNPDPSKPNNADLHLKENIEKLTKQMQELSAMINAAKIAEKQKGETTSVDINTKNLTLLTGAKLGDLQIYGGPALQHLTGEVHLRGLAYGVATGYDAKISPNVTLGWVAGMTYSKPEIALKAALTYRSATKHEGKIAEIS